MQLQFTTYGLPDGKERDCITDEVCGLTQHISMPVNVNDPDELGKKFNAWLVSKGLRSFLQDVTARESARQIDAFMHGPDGNLFGFSVTVPMQADEVSVRVVATHSPLLRALCPLCSSHTHQVMLKHSSFKLEIEDDVYAKVSLAGVKAPIPIIPGVLATGDSIHIVQWAADEPVLFHDFVHSSFFKHTFAETDNTGRAIYKSVDRYNIGDTVRSVVIRDAQGRTIRAVSSVCPHDQELPVTEGVFVVGYHPMYSRLCEFSTFAFLQP